MDGINTKDPAQLKQMQATLDKLGLAKPKEGVKQQHLGQKDFMKLLMNFIIEIH